MPRKEVVTMIVVFEHFGFAFQNNANAVLTATGIKHHIVLLK